MADPELTRQFEEQGPKLVRERLKTFAPWVEQEAVIWLAQKDREARERATSLEDEQMALARSTKEAASEANRLAARSVTAAQTSNRIAAAALIVAIIAIVVSIIGLVHTGAHDDATKANPQAAQTH